MKNEGGHVVISWGCTDRTVKAKFRSRPRNQLWGQDDKCQSATTPHWAKAWSLRYLSPYSKVYPGYARKVPPLLYKSTNTSAAGTECTWTVKRQYIQLLTVTRSTAQVTCALKYLSSGTYLRMGSRMHSFSSSVGMLYLYEDATSMQSETNKIIERKD